jgi:hypothetical protein
MHPARPLASALVLALVSLGALGCDTLKEKIVEKVFEKALEGDGTHKVDISKGGVTVKGKDGETVVLGGDNVKLPEGWPAVVPMYPGAKLLAVMATNNPGQGKGHLATFESADPTTAVIAYYKKQLSGLKVEQEMDMGEMKVASFNDGKGLTVMVSSLGTSQNKRTFQLIVSQK